MSNALDTLGGWLATGLFCVIMGVSGTISIVRDAYQPWQGESVTDVGKTAGAVLAIEDAPNLRSVVRKYNKTQKELKANPGRIDQLGPEKELLIAQIHQEISSARRFPLKPKIRASLIERSDVSCGENSTGVFLRFRLGLGGPWGKKAWICSSDFSFDEWL